MLCYIYLIAGNRCPRKSLNTDVAVDINISIATWRYVTTKLLKVSVVYCGLHLYINKEHVKGFSNVFSNDKLEFNSLLM